MPALYDEWTAEMVLAFPNDGKRYEVLDGELYVTPAPSLRHQVAIDEMHASLRAYVREHALGRALCSPADIVFSPRRLVQPDIFVVPPHQGEMPRQWTDVKELLLAVEVLSPSTASADQERKRVIYQNEGVPEYWIVDAEARRVERWRPGDSSPERLTADIVWQPRVGIEPLRVDLAEYFSEVTGGR